MFTDCQYGSFPVRSAIDSIVARGTWQALIAIGRDCSILNSLEFAPIMSKLMSK